MNIPANKLLFPAPNQLRFTKHTEDYLNYVKIVSVARLRDYYDIGEYTAEDIYQSLIEKAEEEFGNGFLSLHVIIEKSATNPKSIVLLNEDPSLPLSMDNLKTMFKEMPSWIEYRKAEFETFLKSSS